MRKVSSTGLTTRVVVAALMLGTGGVAYATAAGPDEAPRTAAVSPCVEVPEGTPPPAQGPKPTPTTITTLRQAYDCVFAHHYKGPVLDTRTLLTGAMTRLTAELQRRGLDVADATLPPLTGSRSQDWRDFAAMYEDVLGALPDDDATKQALANETLRGMTDNLGDHNGFSERRLPDTLGLDYTFEGRPGQEVVPKDIRDATGPMYVRSVVPNSAAAAAGLLPGDVIEAVDGIPTFVSGKLTPGVIDLLHPRPSQQDSVTVTIHRPASGRTSTVELRSTGPVEPPRADPTVTLLDNGVVHARYPAFDAENATKLLADINALRTDAELTSVVLDVRGNGGGSPAAVSTLLGAFVHGRTWGWNCDIRDRCAPNRTDDSVEPLGLPLVVLTDGGCASACDMFSGAVRDLRLGPLVGARTAGVAAGLPNRYRLNDNSMLGLTTRYALAANREIIDDIGVAVDHQAPMTAADLSAGHDPALTKALTLLDK
jgi:carboxyl-terminal processing protease